LRRYYRADISSDKIEDDLNAMKNTIDKLYDQAETILITARNVGAKRTKSAIQETVKVIDQLSDAFEDIIAKAQNESELFDE
jgi:flagellin-specific chaperone FliS